MTFFNQYQIPQTKKAWSRIRRNPIGGPDWVLSVIFLIRYWIFLSKKQCFIKEYMAIDDLQNLHLPAPWKIKSWQQKIFSDSLPFCSHPRFFKNQKIFLSFLQNEFQIQCRLNARAISCSLYSSISTFFHRRPSNSYMTLIFLIFGRELV